VLRGEVSNEVVYDKVLEVALTYLPPKPPAQVAPQTNTSTTVSLGQTGPRLPQTGTAFAGGGTIAYPEEPALVDADRWADRRKIDGLVDLLVIREVRQVEVEYLSFTRHYPLHTTVYNPLAGGFLSGKYKPGATFAPADVRAKHKAEDRDRKIAEAQRIQQTEVPAGVDMASWALAWCLRDPVVTCVIPGCKDVQQVESNARAADLAD
jgi:hypothetical protein